MIRVRRIYYLRKVFSGTALKLYGSMAALGALMFLVSVPNVFANTPLGLTAGMRYLLQALYGTEPLVQALSLSALVFMGMVVRDLLAMMASGHTLRVRRHGAV